MLALCITFNLQGQKLNINPLSISNRMTDQCNDKRTDYFSGKKVYGDDFSIEQITKWYEEESEGYANLGSKDHENYWYEYHEMNKFHGFKKLKKAGFNKVLGFGSAWGHEFEPIIDKISEITIIDPSENLKSTKIGDITPKYLKPNVDGHVSFANNSFDLITSFGTLHHVPNVSFILSEMIRVLKPNGYLLIREPIISMGNWQEPREGLTKNERGIPVAHFDEFFAKNPVKIISKDYCFCATSIMERFWNKFFKTPLHSLKPYVYFDHFLSQLLKGNVHYHAQKKIHRIAPASIFYVVKKSS